jgi:pterin-4a-carbinolamine dehydratase
MKLKTIHENYIQSSKRPMSFGRLPVEPKNIELPVIPMDKWVKKNDPKRLVKTFRFRRSGDRSLMIKLLLDYEEQMQHNADMVVKEETLQLELFTKNIETITELDLEYAKYADEVFKDIVYYSYSSKKKTE